MIRLLFLFTVFYSSLIHAHPHVFIDATATLLKIEKGKIIFKASWAFDDSTSRSLIIEDDANRDGKLNKKEKNASIKNFHKSIKEYGFFTTLTLNKKKQKIAFDVIDMLIADRDMGKKRKRKEVTFQFLITVDIPKNKNKTIKGMLSFYDHTTFSAIMSVGKMQFPKNIRIISNTVAKNDCQYDFEIGLP